MNEREQIITFLLTQCDQKNNIIAQLQTKIAEFEKRLAESNPILNATAEALEKTKTISTTAVNGKTSPLPEVKTN